MMIFTNIKHGSSRLIPLVYLLLFSSIMHAHPVKCPMDQVLEGATLDYPPYQYLNKGEAAGVAVEVIKEASRRAGFKDVFFTFYPWKRAVNMAKSGENDFLFNAGKNRDRQEWGWYSSNILIQQKYVLFKRKHRVLTVNDNFDNTADYKIAVRRGYLYGTGAFRHAIDNNQFKKVYLSESTAQSTAFLLKNRIDLFIGDYLPVTYYLKKNGLNDKVDIISMPDKKQKMVVLTWPTYVLFSKETIPPDCVVQFDNAMEEMKLDGSYDNIFKKYEF